MNDAFQAAVEVQAFLQSKQWRFRIIEGLALARWVQLRTTADVDVTLLTGFGSEEKYIAALLERFPSRRNDPEDFALQNRVLLLKTSQGIGIDIALGALPFEEGLILRATELDFGRDVLLLTASAEDLIVLKSFAGRSQDWIDIEGILIRQGDILDWDLVLSELAPLCELKESPETVTQLLRLRDSLAA